MRAVIFVTCSELCSLITPHQLCLGISLGFCPAHHTQVSHDSCLPLHRNDDKFTSEGTLSSGTCNHFLWLYLTQPADLLHGCFPLGIGVLSLGEHQHFLSPWCGRSRRNYFSSDCCTSGQLWRLLHFFSISLILHAYLYIHNNITTSFQVA